MDEKSISYLKVGILMQNQSKKFMFLIKSLKKHWKDEEVLETAKVSPHDFSRHRTCTLTEWLFFFLQMKKTTVTFALSLFTQHLSKNIDSISSQAFSQARLKIKPIFFLQTLQHLNTCFYAKKKMVNSWHGFRLLAVDGSKTLVPNTEELRSHYGISGRTDPGYITYGSASSFVSLVYDVTNDLVCDVLIAPYRTSERKLAETHINNPLFKNVKDKNLFIFDRGYASKSIVALLLQQNQHFIFRLQSKAYYKLHQHIQEDGLIDFPLETDETVKLRIIKITGPGREDLILLTNVFSGDINASMFDSVYAKRWVIESKYFILKHKLEMINYSGRTIIAIEQDIYRTCLLANIVGAYVDDATSLIIQKKQNKYRYKASISFAIGLLFDNLIYLLAASRLAARVKKMLVQLSSIVVAIKPHRSIIRRAQCRKSRYHQNSKSAI